MNGAEPPNHLQAPLQGAADALERLVAQVEQLEGALQSRIVLEQANGVLMAAGVSDDEAFELLKRASQTTNRKIGAVARDVLDGRIGISDLV